MRGKARGVTFFLVILALGIGLAWGSHSYVKSKLPEIESAREAALREGPAMMARLGTYPNSVALEDLTQELTSPGKGMWKGVKNRIVWRREFRAPGVKEEMLKWYSAKLHDDGWVIWDPSATSEIQTQWCKPNWLLTIQHNVKHENFHRFVLQLEWMWSFTADRCPLD
ncbi:MAG: hypothetical protein J5J00_06520 [Deltaproteobacteria bacterium]|nr:hypothetical protein [Deltaproteobacteria bacterium]